MDGAESSIGLERGGGIPADVPRSEVRVVVRTDSSSLCCWAKESDRAAIASSTFEGEEARPGGPGTAGRSGAAVGGGVTAVVRGLVVGTSSSASLSLAGLLRILGGGAPDLL